MVIPKGCIKINNRYSYLSDYNLIINNELKSIFLKYSEGKNVAISNFDLNKDAIMQNVRQVSQVTFELSQDCNMRCHYCPYNGTGLFDRDRTNLNMNSEIAMKGIDHIYSIAGNRNKKELTFSIYGGEPLLNFKMIKQIVRYTKKKFEKWKLGYSITTNGTLINSEIITFFISNDISVAISLDGPLINHDAKRVFPGNIGTYSRVWKNILAIKKADPEYFQRKVSFIAVYSKDLSLIDTFNFFLNNKDIKGNRIRFNSANFKNSNYYNRYPNEHPNFRKDLDKIKKRIRKKLKVNKALDIPIEKEFSNLDFVELRLRSYSTLAGACTFSSRLFLDAEGKFHICEKMNNKFPIGDVQTGFDYEEMQKIVKKYTSITKNHCMKCKFKFLCSPCYIYFAEDGVFRIDKEFCKSQKKYLRQKLGEYVRLNAIAAGSAEHNTAATKMRFHQFIAIEKGPVNTAIIDLLKGNIFQVENDVIEKFKSGKHEDIMEFVKSAIREEIVIEVDKKSWIPSYNRDKEKIDPIGKLSSIQSIELEIEDGVDFETVKTKFSGLKISRLTYYGDTKKDFEIPGISIKYYKKNFNTCLALAKIDGNFKKIQEDQYTRNRAYNSCWGKKIAVSKDGKIRPCIYSNIIIGDIDKGNTADIMERAKEYWYLTKEKIDKCKDCELKYACFDCREIAIRWGNSLSAPNPFCEYNPYTGSWEGENRK